MGVFFGARHPKTSVMALQNGLKSPCDWEKMPKMIKSTFTITVITFRGILRFEGL